MEDKSANDDPNEPFRLGRNGEGPCEPLLLSCLRFLQLANALLQGLPLPDEEVDEGLGEILNDDGNCVVKAGALVGECAPPADVGRGGIALDEPVAPPPAPAPAPLLDPGRETERKNPGVDFFWGSKSWEL